MYIPVSKFKTRKCAYCNEEYEIFYNHYEYTLIRRSKTLHFCSFDHRSKYLKEHPIREHEIEGG